MDLKQTIREKGLRQRDIAGALGVSEATMSKWVNRDTPIPMGMIRPLAAAIGVTLEDIVPEAPAISCAAMQQSVGV